MVVLFYKDTANIESGNTVLPMEMQSEVPVSLWPQYFHQLINTSLVLCVSVWRHTFNICCWFINFEIMANSPVTHTWMRLMEHIYFLHRHITAFLCLKTLLRTSVLCLGPVHVRKFKSFPTSKHVCGWLQMHQGHWFWGYKWILTSR